MESQRSIFLMTLTSLHPNESEIVIKGCRIHHTRDEATYQEGNVPIFWSDIAEEKVPPRHGFIQSEKLPLVMLLQIA